MTTGEFEAFHLYSMRQAIEEDFILDVLRNYATYKAYWRLLKTIEDDPRYDKKQGFASAQVVRRATPHAIDEKVRIMVEHFAAQVQDQIGGRAKAMIVTRSRLARGALQAGRRQVSERARAIPSRRWWPSPAPCQDGGRPYTESGMNSEGAGRTIGERQTAKDIRAPEYRFLIVANKFQTGFDQPLLHTMYVDKKLGGVNAVQTLSRLNRTFPGKKGTPWCSTSPTRPRRSARRLRALLRDDAPLRGDRPEPALRDPERILLGFHVYTEADVRPLPSVYFDPEGDSGLSSMPRSRRSWTASESFPRRGAIRLPRPADGLHPALCLPLAGAAFRGRGPREALRLRPPPAAAGSRRP